MCIYLYSNDVNRQIEYAIITRDIYELCEVPKVGFCNGVCSNGLYTRLKYKNNYHVCIFCFR